VSAPTFLQFEEAELWHITIWDSSSMELCMEVTCAIQTCFSSPCSLCLIFVSSSGTGLSCTWCRRSTSLTSLTSVMCLWGRFTCSHWSRSHAWLCSGYLNPPSWLLSSLLWYVIKSSHLQVQHLINPVLLYCCKKEVICLHQCIPVIHVNVLYRCHPAQS